jgi:hypothetical protein
LGVCLVKKQTKTTQCIELPEMAITLIRNFFKKIDKNEPILLKQNQAAQGV